MNSGDFVKILSGIFLFVVFVGFILFVRDVREKTPGNVECVVVEKSAN